MNGAKFSKSLPYQYLGGYNNQDLNNCYFYIGDIPQSIYPINFYAGINGYYCKPKFNYYCELNFTKLNDSTCEYREAF